MHHLRLFGGVTLQDEAGPVDGPAAQRHRLGLLAVLSVAHPAGVPRATLMGLLWPERDGRRAGNLLNQAVHQLRKRLGSSVLITAGDEVRVDALALSSDLLAFRQALQADDLRRAIAVQTGAFMEGFSLPAGRGFEQWVQARRDRLRGQLAAALEALAEQEERIGDPAAAAALWRRRVELDPCFERATVGLMRTLEAAGDRAGAIRAADDHVERMRRELGVEADPVIVAAAERLRAGPSPARRASMRRPPAPRSGPDRLDSGRPVPGTRAPHTEAPPRAASPSVRQPLRLVGRGAERERLDGCWREAVRGRTTFALISGEPGIGKTRLADEVLAWATRRGIVTARARCYAAGGRLPFAPVAEWLRSEPLRSTLAGVAAEWLSAVSVLLPEVAGQDAPRSRHSSWPGSRDWRRQRFFRGLAEAVLGDREPRMLFLDDLQWCDPDTLQWLHFLLRQGTELPLMVLGTARVDEAGPAHPLSRLVEALERGAGGVTLTELELEPLGPDGTAALAADMTRRRLSEAEVERLFRETEGNPLFVVEAVRAGWLSDAIMTSSTETGSLPDRVRGVIRARLGRLGPEARTVAALGATAGRAFSPGVALLASDLSGESVADALDELSERRIIRLDGETYDFTHDKLRQVAYADLNPVRRMLLHGRVAEALQRTAGVGADALSGAIASHWEHAGEPGRAVTLYRRAADLATASHGHEEAAAYISRALRLLPAVPPTDLIDRERFELSLQRELGDTLLRTRGWAAPEVAAAHKRELELAEALEDGAAICRALWGIQSVHVVRSEAAAARAVGHRMLALAEARDDPLYLGAAHMTICIASFLMAELNAAAEHAAEGRRCFEAGLPADSDSAFRSEVEVLLVCHGSHTAWFRGEPEKAAEQDRVARKLAERVEYPFVRATALTYSAMLQQYRGDVGATAERAEAAIRVTEEYDFRYYGAVARILRGWAIAAGGRPENGVREIRDGLDGFRATGARIRYPYFIALEADACLRMGRASEAIERLDHALSLCGELGERWYESELTCARSRVSG